MIDSSDDYHQRRFDVLRRRYDEHGYLYLSGAISSDLIAPARQSIIDALILANAIESAEDGTDIRQLDASKRGEPFEWEH